MLRYELFPIGSVPTPNHRYETRKEYCRYPQVSMGKEVVMIQGKSVLPQASLYIPILNRNS